MCCIKQHFCLCEQANYWSPETCCVAPGKDSAFEKNTPPIKLTCHLHTEAQTTDIGSSSVKFSV